ncbi:MAG: glycosyltransferase involved in cell wall biosynthesis [Bradymonadia bacterium]
MYCAGPIVVADTALISPLGHCCQYQMRIGFFTSSILPSNAANGVQVMHMAEAFAATGHDVTLFATEGEMQRDPYEHYGVARTFELQRTPLVGGWPIRPGLVMARQLMSTYAKHRFDMLYSRRVRFLLGLSALGVPLVHEAHSMPSRASDIRARKLLFRLPNFAYLVCISDALRNDYLAAYPSLTREKTIVAHDAATPISMDAPKSPWPGRERALQVGYVGGLYPGRGVEVVTGLAERYPQVDFHLVGGSPEAIAELKQAGITENTHCHGHVPHVQVSNYYARFDILVAPFQKKVTTHGGGGDTSRWMSPLKIFEYMSAGKTIMCTGMPVLREVLNDQNASLVPTGHVDDWATALDELIDDPKRRLALGAQAKRDFEEHYTWNIRAERVIARDLL